MIFSPLSIDPVMITLKTHLVVDVQIRALCCHRYNNHITLLPYINLSYIKCHLKEEIKF